MFPDYRREPKTPVDNDRRIAELLMNGYCPWDMAPGGNLGQMHLCKMPNRICNCIKEISSNAVLKENGVTLRWTPLGPTIEIANVLITKDEGYI